MGRHIKGLTGCAHNDRNPLQSFAREFNTKLASGEKNDCCGHSEFLSDELNGKPLSLSNILICFLNRSVASLLRKLGD